MSQHVLDDPSGLTRRAASFVRVHGARITTWSSEQHVAHWTQLGRPRPAIDQLVRFQERWGGLALPPAASYEGGPDVLDADDPDMDDDGLVFSPGYPRCSVPYSYALDDQGRFGLCGSSRWVPLHASIEGWVEALALTYLARETASVVRRLSGEAATEMIDRVAGFSPVAEVAGLADNWWRLPDVLVAVYTGEARFFGGRANPTIYTYEGVHDAGMTSAANGPRS